MKKYYLFILLLICGWACGTEAPSVEQRGSGLVSSAASSVSVESEPQDTFPRDRSSLDSQEKSIIAFGDNNERRFPAKLKFLSGEVIDVRDVDPYRNLPYLRLREDPDRFEHLYDLSDLSRSEQDMLLQRARINQEAYRETNYLHLLTKAPIVEIVDSLVVVAYHAFYFSNNEDILATEGVAIVYNEQGEEVNRIVDKEDGFYDIRLSADGDYLVQKYGTIYGEDGGGHLETGFKFYNTHTGELIFEKDFGRDQFLDGFAFVPDLDRWFIIERIHGNSIKFFMVDLINKETYFLEGDFNAHINSSNYIGELLGELKVTDNAKSLLDLGFKKI